MCAARQVNGLLMLLLIASSGCATVVSGRSEDVAIRSYPPKAHVAVHNDEGEMVASGVTPMNVKLNRSKGLFKKPPRYQATLQKTGFQPKRVQIDPKFNPWALGNIVLGGPIGLAADAASGAVWRMTPDDINTELQPMQGPMYGQQVSQNNLTQASYAPRQ